MPLTTLDSATYASLSAMVAPAIFLTATGSLIISTSNRMSRVVDRIRVLNELFDKIDRSQADHDFPQDRLTHIHEQLDRLVWRGDRIRYALTALYLAFGAFVGTSLALAADAWAENRLVALPTLLAVVGVGLMLAACINLVSEALQALSSNRREILFHRELHARRKADRAASQ